MTTLAVVPILVQVGTTALATFLAGTGALLAPALRPRDWLGFARRNPAGTALLLCAILGLAWATPVLARRLTTPAPAGRDWAQVAWNLIRAEQLAAISSASPRQLRPVWEFKIPGASFLSTPVIAGNRLYGASCVVDVGGTFGSIFCLDATSGRLIWQVEKIRGQDLKAFFSSPALTADGKFLLIGEGLHFDDASHLYCLEAATGALHWQIDVPKNHVESSPAIRGDVVVVGAGAIERANHLPVEAPGYAFSVRISDGKLLWQSPVIDPESSPAIAPDGTAYIGSGAGGAAVVAFAPTGEVLWKTPVPYPATGAVLLVGDTVVVGTGRGDFVRADPHPAGAVVALDRQSGRARWQTPLPDAALGNLALSDGHIFCPLRDGSVVALAVEDGRQLWRQRLSGAPILAGIAVADDVLYTVSSDGFLQLLRRADGRLLEKHSLNDETRPGRQNLSMSTPTVVNGRVYVGSETGGLRCFIGTEAR